MALSQLPVNHITSNVMATGRSRPSKDWQATMPQVSDKADGFSRATSTIQTMLKNTTEIGDVGPFSIKPSRFPQATPRMIPTHNTAGQQDAGRRSFSKQRYGDTQHDMSASYPANLTSSSLVSVHLPQNQRSYRPSSRGPNNDDGERSYSMTRSSGTNRSGASPCLHSSYRIQPQGDMYGSRPRSPYAYPTRLKRLGYRPSSPAYSDINRAFHPPLTGSYQEAGFRTQSPMSTPNRVPSVLQPALAHADSDFSYRSFSPEGESHRMGAFALSSTRVPTPGLPLGDIQPASQSREALISNRGYPSRDSGRSVSPLPVFYDYTEAFEEKSQFDVSISPEEGHVTPRDHVKLYREVERYRSTNGCVEMETVKRSSYQEESNDMETSSQSLTKSQEAAIELVRRSVLKQQSTLIAPSAEEQERTGLTAQDRSGDNVEKPSPQHVQSEGSFHLPTESPSKSNNGHHEAASSDATASSLGLGPQSVSSGGSMYSVQSSARPENSTFTTGSADTVKPSMFQNQPTQSSRISRKDLNTPIEQSPSLGAALGDSSLDRWSEGEPSEIHSPTPISSPSRRRMFSRIFSIGQDLAGGNESEIASKAAKSDQNINVCGDEINIDIDKIEAMTASRLEHTSMSLPALRAAREDLGDLALKNALMKARGSVGDLSIRTSAKFNDASMETAQNQGEEPTPNVSTLVDAQRSVAGDSPAKSIQENGNVNQAARICDEESNTLSVDSALHARATDVLSLLDYPAFESYSPFPDAGSPSLPYSFIPNLTTHENDTSRTDAEALALEQKKEGGEARRKPSQPILNLKKRAEKASIESLPGSRPWNLATSYPWTDEDPKLEVKMPDTNRDSQADDVKLPRFRLKVHRASSSTIGPMKLVKQVPPPLELWAARKTSLSSDRFTYSTFARKPRPSVTITQYNSSHIGPSTTQSAGNLSSPLRTSIASPCISLVPPSPGLNLEVRSFFSDDSSQAQPKGSLRKRISQLRAMATRGTSTDDVGGAERGLLSSAMGRPGTSGRSVKQEGIPSEGLYNLRHIRWRFEEKVKGWLHRSKDKVLFWGGKMGLPGPNSRSGSGVYSGI